MHCSWPCDLERLKKKWGPMSEVLPLDWAQKRIQRVGILNRHLGRTGDTPYEERLAFAGSFRVSSTSTVSSPLLHPFRSPRSHAGNTRPRSLPLVGEEELFP